MRDFVTDLDASHHEPLCCKYMLVTVDSLSVKMADETGMLLDRTLNWAFGVLATNEYDVLDAWQEPSSEKLWQEWFRICMDRGVEDIRFVASSGPLIPQSALQALYPAATLLPSIKQAPPSMKAQPDGANRRVRAAPNESLELTREGMSSTGARVVRLPGASPHDVFDVVPTRHRRSLAASWQAMEGIRRTASRAVVRHGPFLDAPSATEFALNALRRAEQRMMPLTRSARAIGGMWPQVVGSGDRRDLSVGLRS